MMKISAAFLLIIFVSMVASADIARPDKPKADPAKKNGAIDTTLSIELSRDAKEARLVIPRSQMKQLRAELDALDRSSNDTATAAGITPTQTVVGGGFLSLAIVFAGFWFARSGWMNVNTRKAIAAVAIVLAGATFATIAVANAGPPAEARSISGKMFTQSVHIYGFGWGKVKLEVSDEVKNPKLIVPNPADTVRPGED
jgi:hypothetical protein